MNKKSVVIGMSGGVDSSVGAALLQRQGYDVVGVTMKLWNEETIKEGCSSFSVAIDAKKVADNLGITHFVIDYQKQFKQKVVDYFISEYKHGKTPNPCVVCNKYIKFNALLEKANEIGADYIATGHYAKITYKNGRYLLERPEDRKKDQTYFLYNMTQEQLSRTIFPLYGVTKEETRKIAEEIGLEVFDKPDSQDICFIHDGKYADFIEKKEGKMPEGNFVDINGNILGKHKGIINYTIGQRKGLGIALNVPMYVVKIDYKTNNIVLAADGNQMKDSLYAHNINLISVDKLDSSFKCTAKIRYNSPDVPCEIFAVDDGFKAVFDSPQKSITPGQMVVLYDNNIVIGGGIISV
ncbi:MAG: tRNA 2-thiouridine(34) synthase MnmA [Clostridia bacterium]|nr:tRNA 2-thiouridine(34) synthase MnmA [Clostridia bacterium]